MDEYLKQRYTRNTQYCGEIVKWPTTADCKSAPFGFPGSTPGLTTISQAGIAQLARASAFQAEGREFESRFPLHKVIVWELIHLTL